MAALLHHHRPTAGRLTGAMAVGAVTLSLALAGCGEADSGSEAQAPLPPDGLVAVAGYEYADSEPDPTATAVIDAYESWEILPPPVEVSEDFESGSGPFWTWADATASAEVTAGAMRITNSDAEFGMGSYAELDAAADNVFVTSTVTIAEALQPDEGPGLSVSRWAPDGEDIEQEYKFTFDGREASLFVSTSLDDARLLDSATVPPGMTGEVDIALWVFARGESPFVVGYLDGRPIVDSEGATGSFDTVALLVWSTGAPRVVDFEAAEVRAQAVGEGLPDLFAGRSDHAVERDGDPVATIAVLEPSDYLDDYPPLDDDQSLLLNMLRDSAPAGMTVGSETLAGEPVVQGTVDGASFRVWAQEGRWLVVTAADAAAGSAFVTAYLDQVQAERLVVQQDYTAAPDAAAQTSEGGTTQVLDGALVITPAAQDEPMAQSWPLPTAQSVTLTARWGAPSGAADPAGTWMLEVWGRDPGAGVWLACWSDGTPAELVDMASGQVLAQAPAGECGSAQSMTLTVDNSVDAPYSVITFQAGGPETTAFVGDQRYPLELAGYRVTAKDAAFSVALESITIEVG